MDYLQYEKLRVELGKLLGFKPCYKWITFNTIKMINEKIEVAEKSFKPCYKGCIINGVDRRNFY